MCVVPGMETVLLKFFFPLPANFGLFATFHVFVLFLFVVAF